MSRTAVIALNLGGPDSRESIAPFLFNFFMDRNIIRLPYPLRWLVASLIARRRSRREAGSSYEHLGFRSPLLENTNAQAVALQQVLGDEFRVFVCMRYWHPLAEQVASEVMQYAPDRIVLLPLYPQFSTTTTHSAFQAWDKAAAACGLVVPTARICCYPLDEGFVAASAQLVSAAYAQAQNAGMGAPRVLFSAHGLPEDVIRDGDPYQWQCEQSAKAIAAAAGIKNLDWQICYQSRVGPKKWIGPSTEDALRQAAADKVPVVIYPHAFVNEHVETLVEIEVEYRHLAEAIGVPLFVRVPTVAVHEAFISGLARQVKAAHNRDGVIAPAKRCPDGFRRRGCAQCRDAGENSLHLDRRAA